MIQCAHTKDYTNVDFIQVGLTQTEHIPTGPLTVKKKHDRSCLDVDGIWKCDEKDTRVVESFVLRFSLN